MQRTISQLWREPPAPKRTAAETHMSIVLPDEARTVVTGDFAPGATLGEVISFAASQYSRTTGRTTRAEDLEAPPFTETDRLRAISSLQDGRTLVLHFRRPSASSASASTSAASETRLLPSPVRPPPQEQLPVSWSRTDAWDEDHVKMPCSPRNGTAEGAQKWPIIVGILSTLRSGASAASLSRAILDINPAQATKWDLRGLLRFFESEACPAQEASEFFARTLPRMAALAARLPTLCPEPIPLLSKRKSATVVLSQLQIASLLANAFFCTFPRRNEPLPATSEYASFPTINFSSLFKPTTPPCKLRFIIHYFRRVCSDEPRGKISVTRRLLLEKPDWASSSTPLCPLRAVVDGNLDTTPGQVHVDFANKRLGGGVIGRGSVQEEICFLTHPELIITRLICAELDDTEAVVDAAIALLRCQMNEESPVSLVDGFVLKGILSLTRPVIGLSASFDGTSALWDCNSGNVLAILRQPQAKSLVSCGSMPNNRIFTVGNPPEIALWDLASCALVRSQMIETTSSVACAGVLPGTSVVVCGMCDGWVEVYDMDARFPRVSSFRAHSLPVGDLAFHGSEADRFFTGSDVARLWDMRLCGRELYALELRTAVVESISGLSWNTDSLAIACRSGRVAKWSAESGHLISEAPLPELPSCVCPLTGRGFVCGTTRGSLFEWSGRSPPKQVACRSPTFGIWCAASRGDLVITGSSDGLATLWDSAESPWVLRDSFALHSSFVEDVSLIPI